jgi:hypothetical protein
MKIKQSLVIGLAIAVVLGAASISLAGKSNAYEPVAGSPLAADVRRATAAFQDLEAAKTAGYALLHGCVTGPDSGAMGVHFANGALVGDGELDVNKPEALLYEQKGGRMQLVAVEYVVLADGWSAKHAMPPVLKGQLFSYTGSPNRYGIPAFYSLHVWAWKANPSGMFADWNPRVSCEEYTGEGM